MSPDPSGIGSAKLDHPASLNLYSYVQNDPVNLGDRRGLDCVYMNDAGDSAESVDTHSDAQECSDNGGFWVDGTVLFGFFFCDSDRVILVGRLSSGDFSMSFDNPRADGTVDSVALTLTGYVDGDKNVSSWDQVVNLLRYYGPGGTYTQNPDDARIQELAD